MVNAWLMDDSQEDQRAPHHRSPPEYLDLDQLREIGVEYFPINLDNRDAEVNPIRKQRGYNYADEVECSPGKLMNYDQKLKDFYKEHLHTDEEIRLVLEGSGYFDVRDVKDRWIRILVEPGDLLIIPAGIYHRFTLDEKNYIHVIRLFCGEPVWTPINRPADDNPVRQKYLESVHAA